MYPEYMQESIKKVEASRQKRLELAKKSREVVKPMTEEERAKILNRFHPDYQKDARREIRVGPNKGQKLTTAVADLLETYSRIEPKKFDLKEPDIDTEVLIIGGGGGGCMAAIWASEMGAKVTISQKLRLGDANSMMSQGGMQAAVNPHDSPTIHYLDILGGGHFDNKPELVEALTKEAPFITKYLEELGVIWDKNEEGFLVTGPGGGTSRRRLLSCEDYTGAEIMRTLRDEVRNRTDRIEVLEFTPAVELILDDKGKCAGAVLFNLETEEYFICRAKATIITTGGYGRLHIKGFPTTNHYGATADGLVIAYRAGAKLLYMDSVQYHPTGAVFPEQIVGFLVTEKVRGSGGQPVNKNGELFVFPLEPRDVEAASFIRECTERNLGIKTPSGQIGIWLDSPIIDLLNGQGTIQRTLPAMVRQFQRFDIDITKEPMLVYPTLHYQNGGIEINANCESTIPGLYAAGETSGGLHGRNRLMGNSVLDYNVFGRRAGIAAAEYAKKAKIGKLSLNHVNKFNKEVEKVGIERSSVSPMLLPSYIPEHVKERQKTTTYQGTLY
ncbi:succinate dehydrogenase/fumarate reductase flavoprotein subunit [bacterium]|nr:MAG: succinate dehydrogenase/fumarate reductase flavoprotein subunit [bacterium]